MPRSGGDPAEGRTQVLGAVQLQRLLEGVGHDLGIGLGDEAGAPAASSSRFSSR